MGVTGLIDNGYVRWAGATSWSNWGGRLADAPAVATVGSVTHMVASNKHDGKLVYRTNGTGWRSFTTSGPCRKPAMSVTEESSPDKTLVDVACVGDNGHAYLKSFDSTNSGVGTFQLMDMGTPDGPGTRFTSVGVGGNRYNLFDPMHSDSAQISMNGTDTNGTARRLGFMDYKTGQVYRDSIFQLCEGDIGLASGRNVEKVHACQTTEQSRFGPWRGTVLVSTRRPFRARPEGISESLRGRRTPPLSSVSRA